MAEIASARTDLDFLTELMKRKQRLVHAIRMHEDAKDELKSAKSDVDKMLDELEPHVMRRRDDLSMPKFPMFDQPPNPDGAPPDPDR